jgi:aryl-alcohol dehydrogenase-like predicted oxidoreductase
LPWSPLAGGLLGGALEKIDGGRRAGERQKKAIEKHRNQLEKYEALCKELGHSPANVALAWLLHQPAVTSPIIGPRNEQQLTSVLGSVELSLSKETLERLDAIWPGPGGTAPEAYAW